MLRLAASLPASRSRATFSAQAAAQRLPCASIARGPPASAAFEFACAIPGTIGGGVWMNAGAYGGEFSQVLERALVADGGG